MTRTGSLRRWTHTSLVCLALGAASVVATKPAGACSSPDVIQPEWVSLSAAAHNQLGTDGVVLLTPDFTGGQLPSLSDVSIELWSLQAAPVAATLDSINTQHGPLLILRPDQQLEPNSSYSVIWSIYDDAIVGSVGVTTGPGPGVILEPELTHFSATRELTLTGPTTRCTDPDTSLIDCSDGSDGLFGTQERERVRVSLGWRVASSVGAQALSFRVRAVGNSSWSAPWVAGPGFKDSFSTSFEFDAVNQPLCVELMTQNLRYYQSTVSFQTHCVDYPTARPDYSPLDAQLKACERPPDAADLLARWCSQHADDTRCGDKGEPNSTSADVAEEPAASDGCHVGARSNRSRSPRWIAAFLLAWVATAARRRFADRHARGS